VIDLVARFVDPLALVLVVGGSLLAGAIAGSGGDTLRAMRALGPLLSARPARDGVVADRAVRRIERLSEYKGLFCADRVASPGAFVHRAACRLGDDAGADAFSLWAQEEIEDRAQRHAGAIGVWQRIAEVAPAMGMIGTVIGLVVMFARMNDPAAMGPAMAVAMLATLYGLLLSFVVAGPIAARLQRLSEAELAWQRRAVARLEALARADEEALADWRERRPRRAG
jgi:chemotaxis protein MotA